MRRSANGRSARRGFSYAADRTRRINLRPYIPRGGIRL